MHAHTYTIQTRRSRTAGVAGRTVGSAPRPSTRHRPLIEGRKVLIRYDPRDPTQVVMHGGRFISDWVFAAVGLAAVAAAMTVLAVA